MELKDLAIISRQFLNEHKIYKYNCKTVSDLDDKGIVNLCHMFCEANNIINEFNSYRDKRINIIQGNKYLGQKVTVTVDRPLGTFHPKYKNIFYSLNYGYIEDVFAPDGEEQDCYIMGVYEPVSIFTGKVIAIIRRKNDVEDKWVVAPNDLTFTREEIIEATKFQEQYFDIEIKMLTNA